jgi:hypothetical protein
MDEILSVLEHFGMCRLLVYYFDHPEGVKKGDYRKRPLNFGGMTVDRNHKLLYDAKLIQTVEDPNHLIFVLTEKGKFMAERLNEIRYKL